MAYQDDKYHRQAQVDGWEHLIGYAVVDREGAKIGTLKALWEDYTRRPAYLGVATSWLDMGRIHVVPAQYATVSERRKCLRLPFPSEVVKDAPQCHAADEITLSGETKIRDFYYRKGVEHGFERGPQEPAPHRAPDAPRAREDRVSRPADWSPREGALDEDDDPRSLRDRIRDAVDEGKAKFNRDHETGRHGEYGRAEREMGLPFRDEPPEDRPALRKISHETPVAELVLPRDDEAGHIQREEDDFVPLRRDTQEAEGRRRRDDRDLPLR